MYLPSSSSTWGKILAFIALLALALLVGAALGKYRVDEDKLEFGCLIPLVLYIGLQLKTGLLVIGRSWDTVAATRDKNPRIFWTVLGVEGALFTLVLYGLVTGARAQH